MKIDYASDLHLEFNTPSKVMDVLDGSEVLILAGDILNYKMHGMPVLEEIASRYDKVLMIMGNHEHYDGIFPKTYNKLTEALPSNVRLMENEIETINGQRFVGCTLWSYMDHIAAYHAKYSMNDYRVVRTGPASEPWKRKLTPEDTVSKWINSSKFLEDNVREGDIVITHHAPSFQSCGTFTDGNEAYASDLEDIMLNNKPSHWIHGHIHHSNDYMIGDTNVLSNPYGYYAHQYNFFFNKKSFEVK